MGEEPDAAAFVGSIVFFISFASAFADQLKSNESHRHAPHAGSCRCIME